LPCWGCLTAPFWPLQAEQILIIQNQTTVSWNAKLEIWYLGRGSTDDDTFEPVSEGSDASSDDDDEGESSGGADAAGGSGSAGPSE